jgi:Protein kinase domain
MLLNLLFLIELRENHFAFALIRQMIHFSADKRPSASEVLSQLQQTAAQVTQFTKEDELGEGGLGIVYKRIFQGGPVAIKRMELRRCSKDEKSREEQAIMRRLDHRNVLKLINYFDKGDFR